MSARAHTWLVAMLLTAPDLCANAHAQLHAAIEHEGEERAEQPPADTVSQEADTPPGANHVPPPPPRHTMDAMSASQMIDVMGMDDDASFSMLMLDRFERVRTDDGNATAWNGSAWFGRDFDKLWLKSEGSAADGRVEHADVQALWSHAVAPFWDMQVGVRRDFGRGPDRTWAAFGVQGLAPYWFELDATAYVGANGRSALRFEGEYDLLLTQRWIVQPRFELNAYGKADPALGIGAGVSDAEVGVRLRYEIRREFAPYIGVEWRKRFGASADFARLAGDSAFDAQIVVGVRVWF